jgi:hypothetical protein
VVGGGVVLECVEEFAASGVVEKFGVGVFGDGGGGVTEQFADDFEAEAVVDQGGCRRCGAGCGL